ncbi:LexA/Signal peptidase [Zalerion maritima]|uniref:Mitochondrial inner membrane protease subunit n=1 Tax=Zalerion maritima TaxID=339359 RepID=A0AAD5WQJ0_9PEZI|nr:LexA/Signal peptidase [Zalerion maritima]
MRLWIANLSLSHEHLQPSRRVHLCHGPSVNSRISDPRNRISLKRFNSTSTSQPPSKSETPLSAPTETFTTPEEPRSSPSPETPPSSPPQNPSPPPSQHRSPIRLLISTLKLLAFLHLTSTYLIHPGALEGPSMLPTLPVQGSSVVILSLHRLGWGIKVGDLVCFKNPVRDDDAVKRVVGLEGDYVVWDTPAADSEAYDGGNGGGGVNVTEEGDDVGAEGEGQAWWSSSLGSDVVILGGPKPPGEKKMIQVPKGHVWLAGDNQTASRDSRTYGPVPMALIKGKVIAQWYPWSERKWLRNPITGTI